MKGMNGMLNCRQGNMAHPLQHVLLLRTLLPTLVLGWGEGSPCSVHSAPWTQAPASALNSLETASLSQQLLMSLHHSPNSLPLFHSSIFLFSCFTSNTEDWSPGAALQVEAADRIVCIKKQTAKNSCFSPKDVAVKHLPFLERSRLYRSLA